MNSLSDNCIAKNISITGELKDSINSHGASGQILSSTGTGVGWINNAGANATLDSVTDAGNITTNTISVGSLITSNIAMPTTVSGSFATPGPNDINYVPGINRYVVWTTIPTGSSYFDCAMLVGGVDILATNFSVNGYVNAAGGSDAALASVCPAFGSPAGADTLVVLRVNFSTPTTANNVYKFIFVVSLN